MEDPPDERLLHTASCERARSARRVGPGADGRGGPAEIKRRTAEVGDVSVPWIDFDVLLRWQSRSGAVAACLRSVRPRSDGLRKVLAISGQLVSKPEMKCSLDIPVCCNKSTKAGENGENYARLTAQHDDDAAHRRRSDIASSARTS